ncbi:MAG TPA: polynucleotide kinase-phosphatase [Symbiobacteriaceae bacterium]|nr:polynucleotide kinase-phosphatase [Symbiobacteriaceae bacterium]
MKINIPELSLVVLIGPSGCGKSTFARQHFLPTEVLSSDHCRALVSDDENNQSVSKEAFEVLHAIAARRLALGRLTVVDATNVQAEYRKPLVALAREYHCIPVAIVLDMPESICLERHKQRTDRQFGAHVIRRQKEDLRRSLRGLEREGFRHIITLKTPEEVAEVTIERQPLWNNRKGETGPFDIIGDVHGCGDELRALLGRLGYQPDGEGFAHPDGRKAVFLGDLVDRGPDVPGVLRLVMAMVEAGNALCVPGNHDLKLVRKLKGKDVQVRHGLAESLAQLEQESPEFRRRAVDFLDGLTSHYVLDGGRLVVAHAGLPEAMHGRGSGKVRDFCLYGETTGETDEFGLPVRYNWAADYRGQATVVYGHTPVLAPEWLNRTINIDTGCCFGGRLTALRWPEKELVSVEAAQVYCEPVRPIGWQQESTLTAQQEQDDLLDLADVTGKRLIDTRLYRSVTVREENAAAALEVMSRFAANPKWLIYLPPTMSPPETSQEPGLLEHPAEAFAYFRQHGVPKVVCEMKHMGSRTVVILCRDEAVARRRFGIVGEGIGICYTRTGRRFFEDAALEQAMLERLAAAMERAGLWQELETDWVALDCELMPWSAKAQELLRQQYAAVGAAGRSALSDAVGQLQQAADRGAEVGDLLARFREREAMVGQYVDAYRRYCWPVASLDDLQLAPFHVLATEGKVHTGQDHLWHMGLLTRLCQADPVLLLATPHLVVDLQDEASCSAGAKWWEELTGRGGEGMVVKPLSFVTMGPKGLVQPAVKCRGREYLRIIYGPEYTAPENLERLRTRALGAKRALALREFALGIEALERFVGGEPLRKVHECVFAVLALESEPVDPRL